MPRALPPIEGLRAALDYVRDASGHRHGRRHRGIDEDREVDPLLARLRRDHGHRADVLVLWKLDRLGRSLPP